MKKILSLLLVAVMVFGVIGLVGCKKASRNILKAAKAALNSI